MWLNHTFRSLAAKERSPSLSTVQAHHRLAPLRSRRSPALAAGRCSALPPATPKLKTSIPIFNRSQLQFYSKFQILSIFIHITLIISRKRIRAFLNKHGANVQIHPIISSMLGRSRSSYRRSRTLRDWFQAHYRQNSWSFTSSSNLPLSCWQIRTNTKSLYWFTHSHTDSLFLLCYNLCYCVCSVWNQLHLVCNLLSVFWWCNPLFFYHLFLFFLTDSDYCCLYCL